jgi:hypothetical protein
VFDVLGQELRIELETCSICNDIRSKAVLEACETANLQIGLALSASVTEPEPEVDPFDTKN